MGAQSKMPAKKPMQICRKKTVAAVLASGVVMSLTALTGGIAPAFAKPGDEPAVPTTTVVPEPPAAVTQAPAEKPAEKPSAADIPSAVTPTSVAPAPSAEAPASAPSAESSAPTVEPSAQAPVQTRAPEPVAPSAPREAPVTSTTKSPTSSTSATSAPTPALAPAPSSESSASSSPSAPRSESSTPSSQVGPSPAESTPAESTSDSPTESRPAESTSSSSTAATSSSSTPGSSASSPADSPADSSSGEALPKVIEKVAPQTLQAPEADVQLARSAKVEEAKPVEAPREELASIARIVDIPNRERDPFGQIGQRNDDQVRLAGNWDRNVRQWRPDWIEYDDYYRPVLSNPYRDPVRIVYVYENAPRVAFIPPLGRIVLDVAQFAAYSFTAVVTNTINQAVNVAVGSFFGGGFFPGIGLPLPPPPPALVNYANVPVQVRYPDATYQPFRVSKIVDVGPDRQYGEQKVLLDGVTPAWGQWRQTSTGERSFEVHKTQQFPGLDDPAPGPLPGDYQLTLASDESPSGMNERDVYLVAVAVACGALSIGAVALAVFMGRRRRPMH